jgi:hypothetical protein
VTLVFLEQEIAAESKNNIEGIALHMAIQEKEWIEENFGYHYSQLSPSRLSAA